jgi:hypothetical protein
MIVVMAGDVINLVSQRLDPFILAGGGDRLALALGLGTLKAMLSFAMLDTNDKTKYSLYLSTLVMTIF